MDLNEKAICIKHFADLIEKEATGNANQFAAKLGISRSCLYNLIDDFNEAGLNIKYDRCKESFCFTGDKILKVRLPIQIIKLDNYNSPDHQKD